MHWAATSGAVVVSEEDELEERPVAALALAAVAVRANKHHLVVTEIWFCFSTG